MVVKKSRNKGNVWQVYRRFGGEKTYIGTFTSKRVAEYVDKSQTQASASLRWIRITKSTVVAGYLEWTWIITADARSGVSNRYTLVAVIDGGRKPIVLGRELPIAHCRRLANKHRGQELSA